MKKNGYVICLAAFLIILFSFYYIKIHNKVQASETALQESFSFSGAKVVNSQMLFLGKLPDELTDTTGIKRFADSISVELGIVKDKAFFERIIDNDMIHKIELGGVSGGNKVVRINIQLDKKMPGLDKRVISVDITQDLTCLGLKEIRRDVTRILKKHNINPRVYSCITGSIDGKLDYSQLNTMSKKIFGALDAKKMEGIRDNNLISISAYSPLMNDSITVNKNRINLNLAIRYNSYENKTYIWLASPVITTEY